MRIAMVITSYHPIVGGAEKQVAQIAQKMRAEGHDVHIVTRHHAGLERETVIDGTTVHRIAVPGISALSFVLGAVRKLKALQPDIIHCHSVFTPSIAGVLAKPLTGAGLLAKPMQGGEMTRVASKSLGALRVGVFRRLIDAFPSVSGEITRELLSFGISRAKIHDIPNGVNTDLFYPPASEDDNAVQRENIGVTSQDICFIFAGRFSEQKRLPLLIDAWKLSGIGGEGAKLLIAEAKRIGPESEERRNISDALEGLDGVVRLGHVDNMPQILRAADVFVLPSKSEGLSNALLEAAATGLPVIASDIGGNEDVIHSGENGILVPPDDLERWSSTLRLVFEDADMRRRMGAAARRTIEAHYSIDGTATRLMSLYQDLRRARGTRA